MYMYMYVHEKSNKQCQKKEGANSGQLFQAFALISRVQQNLSLALLGLSSPCMAAHAHIRTQKVDKNVGVKM